VVIDLGPFEEFLLLDQPQKFGLADKGVAVAVDDTEYLSSGASSKRRRKTVSFPTPLGPEITIKSPILGWVI
jgi:hypothetical protein